MLALVEGWVATVVAAAAGNRLPQAGALAEAIRRRRAAGGPAERTFATLVGLELRPRRLREAAAIWSGLTSERGISGRDAIWAHPDLLPTADDFDDPDGFVRGHPELDISDLDRLTADDFRDPQPGTAEPGTGEPGTGEPGTAEPGTAGPGAATPADAAESGQAEPGQAGPGEASTGEASTSEADPADSAAGEPGPDDGEASGSDEAGEQHPG